MRQLFGGGGVVGGCLVADLRAVRKVTVRLILHIGCPALIVFKSGSRTTYYLSIIKNHIPFFGGEGGAWALILICKSTEMCLWGEESP